MTQAKWKTPFYLDVNTLEDPAHDEWSEVTEVDHPVIPAQAAQVEYMKPVSIDLQNANTTHSAPSPVHHVNQKHESDIKLPEEPAGFMPDWLVPLLTAAIVLAVILEAFTFLSDSFSENILLGAVYSVMVGAIFATIAYAIRHYLLDMQKLSRATDLREKGEQLYKDNQFGQTGQYIGELTALYQHRPDLINRLERFMARHSDAHSDRDTLILFSSAVMQDLDKKAYEMTVQRSQETALMVVLSPFAFLDVVLTLWRNVRLIRDVAAVYGARPGFFSSFGLIKCVLQSLAYAQVSELVADSATETLGGSVVASLSAHLAKGMGSGVMTARVGIHAMRLCRPMPFVQDDQPGLKGVRKAMLKSLKGVFEKTPKESFSHQN
jgi:putative membrane protein